MIEAKNTRAMGLFTLLLLFVVLLPACGAPSPEPVTPLVYRDWADVMPRAVLEAFTAETGIPITYLSYETQEEAVAEMRAGQAFDVVVLENQLIPPLVADGLLTEIDYGHVPNFKNVSANFRDLAYDPQNAHSVPYSWGTTGLVVRTDLAPEPVTRWADLWDARYAGQVLGWTLPRYMVGLTLKSLGYSLNSEDPAELEEALERLVALKPGLTLLEWEPAVSAPYLISGEAVVAVGQADDVLVGSEENPAIAYVLPREGGILWGDNWTIPSNARNKEGAEMLIDFLLRPEIAAQIVNETYYWLPNDAALPLVDEELRNNRAIFPASEALQNAEILLPLSPQGEALHQEIWQRFLETGE
jgi:spermidine/putrescine transport system substrate-binding protein